MPRPHSKLNNTESSSFDIRVNDFKITDNNKFKLKSPNRLDSPKKVSDKILRRESQSILKY
jgi:hypothetical protein